MSIFGFYFVSGLLREAGWPRRQGVFRKKILDTMILDSAIDQMVDWAAAIGAGRPMLALRAIAEIFRDRDWSSDDAPSVRRFIHDARTEIEIWRAPEPLAPHHVVSPTRFAKMGRTLDANALIDDQVRLAMEHWFLEGLLWGFGNPQIFEEWYNSSVEAQTERIPFMRQAGLKVDELPTLGRFLSDSEELLLNYERDIGQLSAVPEKMLAEARALGRLSS